MKDVELAEGSDFLYILHSFSRNLAYPLKNYSPETSQKRLLLRYRLRLKPTLLKRESDKGIKGS